MKRFVIIVSVFDAVAAIDSLCHLFAPSFAPIVCLLIRCPYGIICLKQLQNTHTVFKFEVLTEYAFLNLNPQK